MKILRYKPKVAGALSRLVRVGGQLCPALHYCAMLMVTQTYMVKHQSVTATSQEQIGSHEEAQNGTGCQNSNKLGQDSGSHCQC